MNIKRYQFSKIIILVCLVCLFANNVNTFAQNLSFDDLLNLQKEKRKNISKFFKEKNWIEDVNNNNKWSYKKDVNSTVIEAIFTLQTENCVQNIVNFIMSDSSTFNKLKDSFAKVSEQKNKIHSAGRYIEDYIYKELYVRFFKTREVNKIDFYAVWIFSMSDGWYYKKLDKFCFPILNENTTGKSNETRAEFPGGEKEKNKFIERNMEYPYAASEKGIQGTVFVSFFVETDGSLSNIEIIKGLEGGFNEEVIRLIKLMPKWKPATRDGKPIRSKFNMPLQFLLTE